MTDVRLVSFGLGSAMVGAVNGIHDTTKGIAYKAGGVLGGSTTAASLGAPLAKPLESAYNKYTPAPIKSAVSAVGTTVNNVKSAVASKLPAPVKNVANAYNKIKPIVSAVTSD
jgi:hypothetical protein